MPAKFYDREEELEALQALPKDMNLVVVYGRRRIGKTRLILEHLQGKDYRYIFVPKNVGVSRFLQDLAETQNIPRFAALRDAFRYIFETSGNVFIDEFQNLKYMDRAIFSHLQEIIDTLSFEGRNVNVFVAGSSHSMMRDIFMNAGKPLYGRARLVLRLGPLPLRSAIAMLEDAGVRSFEEQIKFYSVFGGVPKYYEYVEAGSFNNQIKKLFFSDVAPLK
ncbi:MAG: hypothetical protein DRN20_06530, partial [Thermoplasmata archaeon]